MLHRISQTKNTSKQSIIANNPQTNNRIMMMSSCSKKYHTKDCCVHLVGQIYMNVFNIINKGKQDSLTTVKGSRTF